MFNNLANTNLTDANQDELALAMGGEPQAKADENKAADANKEGGESNKTVPDKKPAKQSNTSSTKSIVTPSKGSISDIPDDDLSIAMSGQKNDDDDDDDEDNQDDDQDQNDNQDDNAGENNDDQNNDEGAANIDVKDFLKARVNLLIEKGEWLDFEGREDAEWDEEAFEEMEMNQRAYQKEVVREELLNSFGPYGKQIAEYAANGGDPDKLIDLFKEEQRIDNLSIENEDGQRNVISKYYKDVLGWSDTRVNKQMQTLIADNELESTAKEFKDLLKKDIDKQVAATKAEQEGKVAAAKAQQVATLNQFTDSVNTYLNGNNALSAEEKKEILNVLKFDKTLKNGAPVNEFYFKFAEMKKNLPDYIDFVRFVMNPKKFTQSLVTQGNNKAVDKAFRLTRTANTNKTAKTAPAPGGNRTDKPKTAFKLM